MNTIKGVIPNILIGIAVILHAISFKLGRAGIYLHKQFKTKEGKEFVEVEQEAEKLAMTVQQIKDKVEQELLNGGGGNA